MRERLCFEADQSSRAIHKRHAHASETVARESISALTGKALPPYLQLQGDTAHGSSLNTLHEMLQAYSQIQKPVTAHITLQEKMQGLFSSGDGNVMITNQ